MQKCPTVPVGKESVNESAHRITRRWCPFSPERAMHWATRRVRNVRTTCRCNIEDACKAERLKRACAKEEQEAAQKCVAICNPKHGSRSAALRSEYFVLLISSARCSAVPSQMLAQLLAAQIRLAVRQLKPPGLRAAGDEGCVPKPDPRSRCKAACHCRRTSLRQDQLNPRNCE